MKYAYGVLAMAGAIAAVVVGVMGMFPVMVLTALLSVALLLAANADRISSIRASATGFEAKTRAVIDEARATIQQVREVAKIAALANIMFVARAGRWGPMPWTDKEKILSSTAESLKRLSVPDREQEEMFEELHTATRFDYAHVILGLKQVRAKAATTPLAAELQELQNSGFARNPSSDVVEAFLRKAGALDPEAKELIEDYRHYERERKHRRLDVWRRLCEGE